MFKKYLQCESGDVGDGAINGVIFSGILIAVMLVAIAMSYGFKMTSMLSIFGDRF